MCRDIQLNKYEDDYFLVCVANCCLVVRVPGYRSRDPGSIPCATRFSEKKWVWNGSQLRSYLEEKVVAPV
jgi:hypothetical protein